MRRKRTRSKGPRDIPLEGFAIAAQIPMSSDRRPPREQTSAPAPALTGLVRWFEEEPDDRERFAWVLRDSLDELIDGQRTNRWCYQQLRKKEKKYLGPSVEIGLTAEFGIPDGTHLNWEVDGYDVGCMFSKDFGDWEIPMEMYLCDDHEHSGTADHLALLVWMNDDDAQWAAGVVQVRDDLLKFKTDDSGRKRREYNRDNKRNLNDDGMTSAHWLWGGLQDLPPNPLRR